MLSEKKSNKYPFLSGIENLMEDSKSKDEGLSKMRELYRKGSSQIAKKMGEESVEMVIASEKDSNKDFLNEAADVLFYYLMALHARGFSLRDVLLILKKRYKKKKRKAAQSQ